MGVRQQVKDLRSFLTEVKQRYPEELITVEREATCVSRFQRCSSSWTARINFPSPNSRTCAMFQSKPCAFPLLTNLFASRRLCALASILLWRKLDWITTPAVNS